MAVKNSPRVVKRSIKKAEIGIMTPFAIKNAVVIHCTSPLVIEKYSCIEGSAVASRVSFIIPINADRKSTRLNSSHVSISYAVFCLKNDNKLIQYALMVYIYNDIW